MEPKSRREVLRNLGVDTGLVNYRRYILPLVEGSYLALTKPDKPTSSAQGYYTSQVGRERLESLVANKYYSTSQVQVKYKSKYMAISNNKNSGFKYGRLLFILYITPKETSLKTYLIPD